jgi:predicted deacylase
LNLYQTRPEQVPHRGRLYLIPSLNPDGNASGSRFNRNGVDLNRNWETSNWVSNATVPGGQRGAGGPAPFSEPETQALRDLLNSLRASGRPVSLVVLHSTVNNSLRDQVFPGYTATAIHPASEGLARRIGNLLGYRYNTEWTYDTTGEAIAWCAEQNIPAVDIVSKKGSGPSQSQMIQVVEEILR